MLLPVKESVELPAPSIQKLRLLGLKVLEPETETFPATYISGELDMDTSPPVTSRWPVMSSWSLVPSIWRRPPALTTLPRMSWWYGPLFHVPVAMVRLLSRSNAPSVVTKFEVLAVEIIRLFRFPEVPTRSRVVLARVEILTRPELAVKVPSLSMA